MGTCTSGPADETFRVLEARAKTMFPGKRIVFKATIGVGGSATVYQVKVGGEERVIKIANKVTSESLSNVVSANLDHINVVRVYATGIRSMSDADETWTICEYCDRGDLKTNIQDGFFRLASGHPNMRRIVSVALDIALGMRYLHDNKIIHGDLTTPNVLLKSSKLDQRGFVAKVADFGLSRPFTAWSNTHASVQPAGTVASMAPELMRDGHVRVQTDIYAFGILLWTMFTGEQPFGGLKDVAILNAVIVNRRRPMFPDDVPEPYVQLARSCWQQDPHSRPTWSVVTTVLKELLRNTN
jgi:serine/threonine protein kinase